VSGGGVKPWRQKGTGRARQGSIRSPQWAGGGVVFGPVPRSHEHSLPKKVRRAALRGALSLRLSEGRLAVVEALPLDEIKTRRALALLAELGFDGSESLLIVIESEDPKLERAVRNLPWVGLLRVAGLNTYDVLRYARLLVTRAALDAIHARLGDSGAKEAEA
jgi:large subunit ribosomal protein L4